MTAAEWAAKLVKEVDSIITDHDGMGDSEADRELLLQEATAIIEAAMQEAAEGGVL